MNIEANKKLLKVIVVLVSLLALSSCDLPVHCMPKDIKGKWQIQHQSLPLTTQQQTCGHQHPDKNTDHLYSSPSSLSFTNQNLVVDLDYPNIIQLAGQQIGKWSMVYDEGFQLFMDTSATYFAFSRYRFKQDANREPKDDDDEKSEGYVSMCNETFLGWYQHSNGKWGCFYAKRLSEGQQGQQVDNQKVMQLLQSDPNKLKIVQRDDLIKSKQVDNIKQNDNKNKHQIQDGPMPDDLQQDYQQQQQQQQQQYLDSVDSPRQSEKMYDRFKDKQQLYEMPHQNIYENTKEESQQEFEQDISFIELVNDVKVHSPWKAQVYEQFEGKTEEQMKKLIGLTKNKQIKYQQFLQQQQQQNQQVFLQSSSKIASKSKAQITIKNKHNFKFKANFYVRNKLKNRLKNTLQEHLKHRAKEDELLCKGQYPNGMPKCHDWRNYNGVNYDTPIKRQGDCGSCYAVAMLSAIESRIRIKTKNKEKPFLSNSEAISCNVYNQGCNGGYPYLVAKHGHEIGLSLESCSPYNESDQVCKAECLNPMLNTVYRLKEYGYVGRGYYGSTEENSMMQEIFTRGPIVLALNAAPDLYYYSSGVFITNPTDVLEEPNEHPQLGKWMFTNHAVVCVGWGETMHDGQVIKYWILKNSWGEEWGEAGYFRMLRGVNLAAIENQAIYANY